jgi:hypothetical protein
MVTTINYMLKSIREIGKVESVDVGSCKVEVIRHDGTRILSSEFIGRAIQYFEQMGGLLTLSEKRYQYNPPQIVTARELAIDYMERIVEEKHVIINDELVKYEDILSVRIVERQSKLIPPVWSQYSYS